jgi:hypothetical protein
MSLRKWQLISNVYETGEWPKNFTEIGMIALKKKSEATKYRAQRMASLIAHTAKMLAGTLKSGIQRKIEDVLGEDQFEFIKGKGTRDTTGMLIKSSERTLGMDEELCACFIDWMKAFDRVN